MTQAIWLAATAAPLGAGSVYRLRQLPEKVRALGCELALPAWWQQTVAAFTAQAAKPVTTGNDEAQPMAEPRTQ